MINKETNTLNVFDNFIIDRELPKHKKEKKGNSNDAFASFTVDSAGNIASGGTTEVRSWGMGGITTPVPVNGRDWNVVANFTEADPNYWDGISYETRTEFHRMQLRNFMIAEDYYKSGGGKFKFIGKFFLWAFNKKYKNKPTRSVESFFVSLKQDKKQLEKIDDRIEGYKKMLKNAVASGQKALEEKLISEIEIIGFESQLYAFDYVTVLTEEQVVKFVKETKRGLRLDWIKNFTRVIPDEVLAKKVELDERKIFDNWVIMHYDEGNKSNAKTEKEKAEEKRRKEDPILFGVINGSRKLYFVDDYIDEKCDLQLKDIAKELGEKEIKKSELTKKIKL